MAVDESLLASCAGGNDCALRFYGWREPTLSLGYFQPHAQRNQHPQSAACPLVRRPTGGGAILHDDELTYSLILPKSDLLGGDALAMVRAVHESLIEALSNWRVSAKLQETAVPGNSPDPPFLCFQRRAPRDVVIGGSKIAGSAQRRRRSAVLQHGSVLLRASTVAKELPGIEEVTGKRIEAAVLREAWTETLARRGKWRIQSRPLTAKERETALVMQHRRYAGDKWNRRK